MISEQPHDLCKCGHTRDFHDHLRAGTDCAVCGYNTCPRFRAAEPVP